MPLIGVFGGTFDPIHYGHLRAALEVRDALDLSQVRFVPSYRPPHRDQPVASAAQRLSMVRIAIEGQPRFQLDDREILRRGVSFMVETLASLRADLGAVPLGLILGMDAYLGIDRWHRWQEIPDLAHLIVVHRPGSELPRQGVLATLVRERLVQRPEQLRRSTAGKMIALTLTQLDISATRLRRQIGAGGDASYLMPDNVISYLNEHRLYRRD